VAQRDLAARVHDVAAHTSVLCDADLGRSGTGFVSCIERDFGGEPVSGSVGSDGVVVGDEAIDLGLQRVDGRRRWLFGEEYLQRLMEAFDFAASLGMVGPGVFELDPQREEFLL